MIRVIKKTNFWNIKNWEMKTTNYNNNMNGYYVPFDACEDVRMFVTLMADDTKSIIRLA